MALPAAPVAVPYGGPPPTATDPGTGIGQPDIRDAWLKLPSDRLVELSNIAYATGDYRYMSTALRANHAKIINMDKAIIR